MSAPILPPAAAATLRILRLGNRVQYVDYLRALHDGCGWPMQSLATAVGVTRQAVSLSLRDAPEFGYLAWDWPLPTPPVVAPPAPREVRRARRLTFAEVEALKALQAVARTVNGATRSDDPRRVQASEYTRLLAEHMENGLTAYMLAKQLGVTPLAITSRLARYGYRQNVPSMLGTEIKGHAAHEVRPPLDGP